jgi:hypothetical protein
MLEMVGTPDMSASLSGMKLEGLWKRVGEDIDGEAAYGNSGISIAMSSDGMRDAIGAYSKAGNGWYSGHVRVHEWNEVEGVWKRVEDIGGEAAYDSSGHSVAM